MDNDYYVKICLKGHKVDLFSNVPAQQEFCHFCGSKVISFCPKCNWKLPTPKLNRRYPNTSKYILPIRCDNCGRFYPWHKQQKKQVFKQKLLYLTDKFLSIFKIFKS